MRKIISFGLWGNSPKYLVGAVRNAQIRPAMYPDWVCRYYVDDAVPQETLDKLVELGAEIVKKGPSDGWIGLFWRFEPAFDETIDRFMVRDCDSRLNVREVSAVDEWEQSGLPFHAMRDHPQHCIQILGAMWGAVPFFIKNFKELHDDFIKNVNPFQRQRGKYFYTDQVFLSHVIWPLIKDRSIVHDDMRRMTGTEHKFPINLPSGFFVGQQFNENDSPIFV